LNSRVSLNLYRIVQEAVTNALKHSRATHVKIHFQVKNGDFHLIVADNGRGFPPRAKAAQGQGIPIMTYRAESIGAVLQIKSTRAQGTIVCCSIHLPSGVNP
jgi:signal transduction histidine kinase